ncbi:MAG: transposase for insertion sequence element, partial [Candidatus Midichloriaceae bacterium]|nr:transposase for insertion sequence element [Candidatus Midichloriaceae bacterium]
FFVLCFLLVKFINLLDMDGLSVVTLTALSTVMGWRRASDDRRRKTFSGFFLKYTSIKLIQNNMSFYAVLAIKSNTSRRLKKKFEFLKKVYWGTNGIWSDGYFISTVGVNEQVIRAYIEKQGKEDSAQAELRRAEVIIEF